MHRTSRNVLGHYTSWLASLLLVFAHAYGLGQSLKFVPVLYVYQLSITPNQFLNGPTAVAVDVHGNVYVSDTVNQKVWKTTPDHTTTLFAGNGVFGYTGDNGLASLAQLNGPGALAVDVKGNVFIADVGNFAIRRVDADTGIITTVVGGNGSGNTGNGGAAKSAQLQNPTGLLVTADDTLYVSDATSAVVRKISSTGTITLFAGGGSPASGNGDGGSPLSAKLTSPYGIALDASGNFFIADSGASVVREISAGNVISTFAGSTYGYSGLGGPATSAKLAAPRGVAVDNTGNVYIADYTDGLVSVVDSTQTINALAGLAVYGTGSGLPASEAQIKAPSGVAVDGAGNVFFISHTDNQLYQVITHPERFAFTVVGQKSVQQRLIIENIGSSTITVTATSPDPSGDFKTGTTINVNERKCTGGYGSLTAVGTFGNFCSVDLVYTPTAAGIRTATLTVTSNDTPTSTTITLTSTPMDSNAFVPNGEVFTVAGETPDNSITLRNDNVIATTANLLELNGIAFDSTGTLFFSEYATSDVRRVDSQTNIISTVVGNVAGVGGPPAGDGGPATAATLQGLGNVLFGSDGTMYVSDELNHEIRTVDIQQKIHRFAGTGSSICNVPGDGMQALNVAICAATGMAFDSAGNLYFSNALVNAIQKITPAGVLSTVAGVFNAPGAYDGDGGPALSAHLNGPEGLVVNSKGDIFVAEFSNQVIRKIDGATHIISTIAGQHGVYAFGGDGGLATKSTLYSPTSVTLDAAGDLYISDSGNNVVRRIDATTNIITTYAGNNVFGNLYNGEGVGTTAAGVEYPNPVQIDPAGNILFGDRNVLLRKVSPNAFINFGDQQLNTTSSVQTITVSNIGYTVLHFNSTTPYLISGDFAVVPGGTCNFAQSLGIGMNCTVRLSFTPTTRFERYGTFTLYDDGIATPQVSGLRGNGLAPAAPAAVLSPTALNFPNQLINTTSASQTIVLANPGTSPLTITAVTLTGTDPTSFAASAGCAGIIQPGASCNIVVTFTPTAVANYGATVTVTDDATGSPQTAALTGNGVVPAANLTLTPSTINFGNQTVGTTSAAQTFTLSNSGGASATITGITMTGQTPTAFNITSASNCGQQLAGGASCSILVNFTPPSGTGFAATLQVSEGTTTQTALVNGTGVIPQVPQAVLTPSTVTFPNQTSGTTSASQTVTLSNPGNANLNISAITITGANSTYFAILPTSTCGQALAPGGSCTLPVTFTPNAAGSFSATINVVDNAANSPQTSALSGTGIAAVAPDFTVTATPPTASILRGNSATYTVSLASLLTTNPFTSSVTLSASGLPTGATVTFAPPTGTPGATGVNSTMTITTIRGAAIHSESAENMSPTGLISFAFLFFTFIGLRKRRKLPRLLVVLFAIVGSGITAASLTGCGGGFALPATSQTYTITVTGTNGAIQHSTTVTLTVN